MHFMNLESSLMQKMQRQYWCVSRGQLLAHGLTARQIDRRVWLGRYEPIARGIYAIRGSARRWEQTAMAAWLFAAERRHPGILAAQTAGAFWDLPGIRPTARPVLWSTTGDRHPNPIGDVCRRSDLIAADLRDHESGARITAPIRTAIDILLSVSLSGQAAAILNRLLESDLYTYDQLCERFEPIAAANRPGVSPLKPLLNGSFSLSIESAA